MEAIIIFSGSSLVAFLILTLFSKKISLSLPEVRVLRSLGRSAQAKTKEDEQDDLKIKDKDTQKFILRFLNAFAKKQRKTGEKDVQLMAAGLKGWTAGEWKVLNYSTAFATSLFASALGFLTTLPPLVRMELIPLGFLIGFIGPNLWLKSRIKRRSEDILRSLPETLDLIMVSVEAGLGFDAAMMKVVEKQKGVLAEEFNLVLQEIKMGKPRRDALRDMAKKNNVEELNNVIASLVQADQLGISMGSVLRNQSNQIRQKRKQRAQEQAQKAPVKIMIPLVFFIFPSIFIIILGPAFIQIMEYFSN